jgi:hypothetical protein
VSDRHGWEPKNIDAWCQQAAPLQGKTTSRAAFAVSRLCGAMQLKSVQADAEQLRSNHIEIVSLTATEDADRRESLRDREKQCMKKIARAISAAFSTSATDGQPEAVSTPMELLSLVVWQSEMNHLLAAQDCLQSLQAQLGIGDDRPTLLHWLGKVRTFSLHETTGELLEDPNNQWVRPSNYTAPPHHGGTGQWRCSHPPALLISPASGPDVPQGHCDSGRTEYHLLQLAHQSQDSPLHSRYTSSLSNLVRSPMVPLVNKAALADREPRLYFLPVLLVRQSNNDVQGPPAVLPFPLISPFNTSSTSCASQSEPLSQVRCGQAVEISPHQLCTQLGTGRGLVEREGFSGLVTFFGAVLKVGPQGGRMEDTAEVWALLMDSLCRWWVYRIDLSRPSAGLFSSQRGDSRQSLEPVAALHHLLGLPADASSASRMDHSTMWNGRCQQIWTAVLSWLHFAEDDLILSEVRLCDLPDKLISITPQQQENFLSASTEFSGAADTEVSEAVVQLHRTEEDEEEKDIIGKTPRRSTRSQTHGIDDALQAPVSERSTGWMKKKVKGTGGQGKVASNKNKDKAAKAKLAAEKKKRKEAAKVEKEKEAEKKKREKEAMRRLQEEEKEEERQRKRRASERKKGEEKKKGQQQRYPQPEVMTQHTELAEGVCTRGGAAKHAIAINKQPTAAGTADLSSGRDRGKKRKGKAGGEEKTFDVSVEDGDAERKPSNASRGRTPLAQLSAQSVNSSASSSVVSGPSSTPSSDVDSTGLKSHDAPDDLALARPPTSLWHLYMTGYKGLIEGQKLKVKGWFNLGSNHGPNANATSDKDLHGPTVDIMAEWDFLRQTRWTCGLRIHPSKVTPLDTSKEPRVEHMAQCFVASVGLCDHEVQDAYLAAVTTHRLLTDRYAKAQGRKAQHIHIEPPWEKFKGITLTTIDGNRLDEAGEPIEHPTPSYALGSYPDLDTFRAGLAESRIAKERTKEERSPSLSPRKKVKTERGSTSVVKGSDGRVRRGVSSPVSGTSKSEPIAVLRSIPDRWDLRKQVAQMQSVLHKLTTRMNIGVEESSSSDQSPLSVSDADCPSPVPSSHTLSSTNSSSRVAPVDAPVQSAASRPPNDNTSIIQIPASSSSANQLPLGGVLQRALPL